MILKLGVPLATAAVVALSAGSVCAGEKARPDQRAAAHTGSAVRGRLAQLVLPPIRAFKPIGGDRPYMAMATPAARLAAKA